MQPYNKAEEKGRADEINRYKKIAQVCGDDHELAGRLFAEGKSENEALAAKNAALTEQLKQAENKPPTTEAAVQDFNDEASQSTETETETADGEPKTFWDAVDKVQREKKMTKADAIRFCAGEYPKLHQKMKDENTRVDDEL